MQDNMIGNPLISWPWWNRHWEGKGSLTPCKAIPSDGQPPPPPTHTKIYVFQVTQQTGNWTFRTRARPLQPLDEGMPRVRDEEGDVKLACLPWLLLPASSNLEVFSQVQTFWTFMETWLQRHDLIPSKAYLGQSLLAYPCSILFFRLWDRVVLEWRGESHELGGYGISQ